jgi:hypothetical protein
MFIYPISLGLEHLICPLLLLVACMFLPWWHAIG